MCVCVYMYVIGHVMCTVFVTYVECKYMDLIETVPVNKCVIYMKNKLDSLWSFK